MAGTTIIGRKQKDYKLPPTYDVARGRDFYTWYFDDDMTTQQIVDRYQAATGIRLSRQRIIQIAQAYLHHKQRGLV